MATKAVILSGGFGTPCKPPLSGGVEGALGELQIESLAKCGFEEVIVLTDEEAARIAAALGSGERYGVKLYVHQEDAALGAAGALKRLAEQLQEPFLVTNGGLLTSLDFGKMYATALRTDAGFLAGVKALAIPYYAHGSVFLDGEHLLRLQEEIYVLAGVNVLKPELLSRIPPDQYFDMDMLLQRLLDAGMPVIRYDVEGYWVDVGQVSNFAKE